MALFTAQLTYDFFFHIGYCDVIVKNVEAVPNTI